MYIVDVENTENRLRTRILLERTSADKVSRGKVPDHAAGRRLAQWLALRYYDSHLHSSSLLFLSSRLYDTERFWTANALSIPFTWSAEQTERYKWTILVTFDPRLAAHTLRTLVSTIRQHRPHGYSAHSSRL